MSDTNYKAYKKEERDYFVFNMFAAPVVCVICYAVEYFLYDMRLPDSMYNTINKVLSGIVFLLLLMAASTLFKGRKRYVYDNNENIVNYFIKNKKGPRWGRIPYRKDKKTFGMVERSVPAHSQTISTKDVTFSSMLPLDLHEFNTYVWVTEKEALETYGTTARTFPSSTNKMGMPLRKVELFTEKAYKEGSKMILYTSSNRPELFGFLPEEYFKNDHFFIKLYWITWLLMSFFICFTGL